MTEYWDLKKSFIQFRNIKLIYILPWPGRRPKTAVVSHYTTQFKTIFFT